LAANPNQPPEPRRVARSRRSYPSPALERRRGKLAGRFALGTLLLLAVITGVLAGLTLVYSVNLPQINDLERYRPSTVTDLYDRKGRKIGSFALQKRILVGYDDFAPVLRQAVLSIEDKSFESHWGVNVFRIAGAAWHDIRSHGRVQGASTLTMQLARNLFLSSTRTATRKVQEAYLAIQIERAFTKEQIFTLYGNQIYLGHGMYGFEAASQFYFSKHAKELNLTEAALLAGLPKGPVAYSPIINPDKALRRRNLVLSEMESDGAISHAVAEKARLAPLGLHVAQPEASVAPWFQEEVRRELEQRFGTEEVHEAGLHVDTTLDLDLQQTANRAVADGLTAYEHRRGWKGKLENILTEGETIESYQHPDWAVVAKPGTYVHALVTRVLPMEVHARVGSADVILLQEDWKWTGQSYADALVKPGDIIYIHLAEGTTPPAGVSRRATLEQDSGAQGALMAIDNVTGDVLAMVGGRDYALSQFNRSTQAERQTGSSFKPYVYTAAIEDGAKPTDLIVDGPVSWGGYSPHNYENDYKGTMTLLNAFAESRNIPALKLAAHVGIRKVIEVTHRFGVTSSIPAYLPIAIGAVEITLEEQVASYSVFPNDGVRVTPRLIRSVSNADGITMWQQSPSVNVVISRQTARTMMTLLRAVIAHGTGAAASQLNHPLGGKTGTTSDYTDAWFLGFSPSVTCGVWVGYDSRESLGEKETGAKAALPIWMTVMRTAITGKDNEHFPGDEESKSDQKSAGAPLPADRSAQEKKPSGGNQASQTAAKMHPAAATAPSSTTRPAATGTNVKTLASPARPGQPSTATPSTTKTPAQPGAHSPTPSAASPPAKPASSSAAQPRSGTALSSSASSLHPATATAPARAQTLGSAKPARSQ
jgi:penicillin-binding protein 1A